MTNFTTSKIKINMNKKERKMWGANGEVNKTVQCSLVKPSIVYIEPIPKRKINLLMDKYPHQEWLGYLQGEIEEENVFVKDILIPPHTEATAASAEAEPFNIPMDCVGIIHSHNTMGAFHSQTDIDYVDKNFYVSITVAKKTDVLEFDSVSYRTTLCGKKTVVKCSVKFVQPELLFKESDWLEEAVANVEKGRKIVSFSYGGIYENYYGVPEFASVNSPVKFPGTLLGKGRRIYVEGKDKES